MKNSLLNVLKQSLWAVPFLTLSIAFGVLGWHRPLDKYEPVLLTINITIAIFAVNFSFLEYQFSPYRALLRSISARQILASVITLILAISPLVGLVINSTWAPTIALITIPLVAYASVGLGIIARREANSIALLQRTCSDNSIQTFLAEFGKDATTFLQEINQMELSNREDMPMQELFMSPPAPQSKLDDPFNFIASLGLAAIQNSDVYTYEHVLHRALKAATVAAELKYKDEGGIEHKIESILVQHVRRTISRLSLASYELDKSDTFATKYLDICALFIRKQAMIGKQTSDISLYVANSMVEVTKQLLRRGNREASLVIIAIARQAAQKGLDTPSSEDFLFVDRLRYFPEKIKELGQEAIRNRDAEYLYRCFDALGWLGCSAVKVDNREVGTSCLQNLAQLGRESRAAGLECFWSHCAIKPEDHSSERLFWMASWVPSLEGSKQPKWLESIEESFSRLSGNKHTARLEKQDGKNKVVLYDSNKKHQVLYSVDGISRTVDYSDPHFTKDLKLY